MMLYFTHWAVLYTLGCIAHMGQYWTHFCFASDTLFQPYLTVLDTLGLYTTDGDYIGHMLLYWTNWSVLDTWFCIGHIELLQPFWAVFDRQGPYWTHGAVIHTRGSIAHMCVIRPLGDDDPYCLHQTCLETTLHTQFYVLIIHDIRIVFMQKLQFLPCMCG